MKQFSTKWLVTRKALCLRKRSFGDIMKFKKWENSLSLACPRYFIDRFEEILLLLEEFWETINIDSFSI